ncbi:MAG TPA: hypothetical protein VIK49_05275, partial [Steroidobacteraceae bacterium]
GPGTFVRAIGSATSGAQGRGVLASKLVSSGGVCERETPPDPARRSRRCQARKIDANRAVSALARRRARRHARAMADRIRIIDMGSHIL